MPGPNLPGWLWFLLALIAVVVLLTLVGHPVRVG